MARRPDERENEILSEENLKELRYNLAHLRLLPFGSSTRLRTAIAADLQPSSHPPDPDSSPGVETTLEVAVFFLSRFSLYNFRRQWQRATFA
jgi:hypothetical protein